MVPDQHKPKVSIVTSICKEPLQWIQFAYESVLKQTFTDFELIIVCDNPENTEAIDYIRSLKDSRIKLIVNGRNLGPTKSFNIGIASSTGEYIARFDADDICLPERLQRQVEYLDSHPEINVCATDAHIIDHEGKIIRKNRYRRKRDHTLLAIQNCIAHPSVMFRRSLLKLRNPLYNEDYRYSQDYELWQFLILNGQKFHTLEETLLLYRRSGSQITRARREEQVGFFKQAHKEFILNWLIEHKIIEATDADDLRVMLSKCSGAYSSVTDKEERKYLTNIIYVLYFCLGTYDRTYRVKYLADRNLIAFRIRFILTYRLLFSRKTRKHRAGFI